MDFAFLSAVCYLAQGLGVQAAEVKVASDGLFYTDRLVFSVQRAGPHHDHGCPGD